MAHESVTAADALAVLLTDAVSGLTAVRKYIVTQEMVEKATEAETLYVIPFDYDEEQGTRGLIDMALGMHLVYVKRVSKGSDGKYSDASVDDSLANVRTIRDTVTGPECAILDLGDDEDAQFVDVSDVILYVPEFLKTYGVVVSTFVARYKSRR